MRRFNTLPQPPSGTLFIREAVRAIILQGEDILLLYTARYDDFTLPGGGVDEGETHQQALTREVLEETGAKTILSSEPFGLYEEYQRWHKPDYDHVHIRSFCFLCEISDEFIAPKMEDYEVNNGMKPVWVNIHEALAHNKNTLANSEKKGQSLQREILLLEHIKAQLT